MSEPTKQPCTGCGEPTLNVPPVCRDCDIEQYHREVDKITCATCKRIRYTVKPDDLVEELRAMFWGEPCACPAHAIASHDPSKEER